MYLALVKKKKTKGKWAPLLFKNWSFKSTEFVWIMNVLWSTFLFRKPLYYQNTTVLFSLMFMKDLAGNVRLLCSKLLLFSSITFDHYRCLRHTNVLISMQFCLLASPRNIRSFRIKRRLLVVIWIQTSRAHCLEDGLLWCKCKARSS